MTDPTLDYYDTHAEDFERRTRDRNMRPCYDRFLALLPARPRVLDAGCGPGRDSLALAARGCDVTGFDASAAMVALAAARTGRPVLHLAFQDLAFDAAFDGIWACASLLHVRRAEMPDVFARLRRALRPGGILFASFKAGPGEEFREERWFNDYDEATFRALVASATGWAEAALWRVTDDRPGREGTTWLNTLLRAV
jgi:SAM-dependent methyltransferase